MGVSGRPCLPAAVTSWILHYFARVSINDVKNSMRVARDTIYRTGLIDVESTENTQDDLCKFSDSRQAVA